LKTHLEDFCSPINQDTSGADITLRYARVCHGDGTQGGVTMLGSENLRAFSAEHALKIGLGTLLLFCICLGLVSCRQVPVDVAAPRPQAADAASARLEAGRAIYVSPDRCASCHKPKPVSSYDAQEWSEKILPKMARKARLTPGEYADVLAYVTSLAILTPPPTAAH
jgi:hypothetical protein